MPFIVGRLNEMRQKHNILLVTNDHVDTLKAMADNTVTVSAIDRDKVKINGKAGVDRQLALLAMSVGDGWSGGGSEADLRFFAKVEFSKNGGATRVSCVRVEDEKARIPLTPKRVVLSSCRDSERRHVCDFRLRTLPTHVLELAAGFGSVGSHSVGHGVVFHRQPLLPSAAGLARECRNRSGVKDRSPFLLNHPPLLNTQDVHVGGSGSPPAFFQGHEQEPQDVPHALLAGDHQCGSVRLPRRRHRHDDDAFVLRWHPV